MDVKPSKRKKKRRHDDADGGEENRRDRDPEPCSSNVKLEERPAIPMKAEGSSSRKAKTAKVEKPEEFTILCSSPSQAKKNDIPCENVEPLEPEEELPDIDNIDSDEPDLDRRIKLLLQLSICEDSIKSEKKRKKKKKKTKKVELEDLNQNPNTGNETETEVSKEKQELCIESLPLVEESESQISEEPGGTVVIKHPLLIPEILEVIFRYLAPTPKSIMDDDTNAQDLFSCQNVCLLWNELITKQMESTERYPVEVPTRCLSLDDNFKKIIRAIPKHRSSFGIHTMPNNNMEYFCRRIGPQMKSLHITLTCVLDHTNSNFIQYISRYCRKLDELSIDLSDCRTSVFDDPDYGAQTLAKVRAKKKKKSPAHANTNTVSETSPYFLKIRKLSTQDNRTFRYARPVKTLPITLAPFLQVLSFSGNSDQLIFLLETISKSAQKLEKLSHLEFYYCSTHPLDEKFIQFFLKQRWTLKSFKLRFRHNVPIRNARVLFHHLKETLVHLTVEFDFPEFSMEMPFVRNFLVPLNMPKLEKMEINEQSTLSLINALHLPTLKSCICFYSVMGQGSRFNKVSTENPPKFTNRGHSLESLTIYENSIDLPIFDNALCEQLRNPFTNLKNLHLEHATHYMLQTILANQIHLERLKLCNLYSLNTPTWDWNSKSQTDMSDRSIDWDELITGFGKASAKRVKKCQLKLEQTLGSFTRVESVKNRKVNKCASSGDKNKGNRIRSSVNTIQGITAKPSKACSGVGPTQSTVKALSSSVPTSSSKPKSVELNPQQVNESPPLKRIGPSITNLKKLTYLFIGFESSSSKLTDFTIYNGLMHLNHLQFLELNQQTFSSTAVAALQSKLLPFCRVTFNK